ncbi:class I SAM-dependent methyltransferase [Azospirillum sp. HJ39]|uniref:class I SAM-dependent methyltransferase n=1 Tax=Azospirillum sp. HJ39 TaxID=3159496 RepID=UPI003557E27D
MAAPTDSRGFDRAYSAPLTMWGDWRIPGAVKDLVAENGAARALELGCGVGRISRYMARHGLRATGVDFSPVAIDKATSRVAGDPVRPEFLVDDVRELSLLTGPFDLSVDIGCFHCLDREGQARYAAALARLLRPGATHLMWVMENAPSNRPMGADEIGATFAPSFRMAGVENRRRRLVRSRWFWLERREAQA